jgi:hypothetical protein
MGFQLLLFVLIVNLHRRIDRLRSKQETLNWGANGNLLGCDVAVLLGFSGMPTRVFGMRNIGVTHLASVIAATAKVRPLHVCPLIGSK